MEEKDLDALATKIVEKLNGRPDFKNPTPSKEKTKAKDKGLLLALLAKKPKTA